MELLRQYFNAISPISEEAWVEISSLFKVRDLTSKEFFIDEYKIAKEIAFLETGCVRAFFTNEKGKEYNKQFFVGPALIGPYTSLLTKERNKIPQQALTDCKIWVANYDEIEQKFKKFHDLERLGRKVAEFYFLEKEKKS
ncbi:MAG: Crp/Fnr family transcriptional regulator [Flavobacteriales bacterium]|nr:Crp/Fnr family transcriptional regulator [Flavobacteriales bacterium]